MSEWLSDFAGEGYATALIWTLAALILLLVLLVVARIVRNFTSGTFIAGGRNRVPRLAIVDAAAVDSQRRLVLVRRDDVEHLLLIGGPSDVVVEQQIRAKGADAPVPPRSRQDDAVAPAPPARQTVSGRPRPAPDRPAAPPPPVSREAAPIARPERVPASERPPQAGRGNETTESVHGAAQRPVAPEPQLREVPPVRQEEPRTAGAATGSWKASQPQQRREPNLRAEDDDGEAALLEEIDFSVDELSRSPTDKPVPQRSTPSIEDEMSRLLDDLADERKKEG